MGFRARFELGPMRGELRPGRADPTEAFQDASSRSPPVGEAWLAGASEILGPRTARYGEIVVRVFPPTGAWFADSGGRTAYLTAFRLRAAGIASPEPLGFLEGGRDRPSYAAFAFTPSEPFEVFARATVAEKGRLLRALGRGLGRLHGLGAGLIERPELRLADAELSLFGVDRLGPPEPSAGAAVLVDALPLSRTHRLRLIDACLERRPAAPDLRRSLLAGPPHGGDRPLTA